MSEPKVLFKGVRFHVVSLTQTMPDGSSHERQIVRHPGAVAVIPLLDDQRICLVENYRAGVDETLLELPAGTLEPGESPEQTALRELAEETGYRAGRLEQLTMFYTSPGILDERMFLFLATELEPGRQALEAGEQIEPRICTWSETLEMIRRGRIRDGKTLVGLLYCHALLGHT